MEESKLDLLSVLLMNRSVDVCTLASSLGTTSNKLRKDIKEFNRKHDKEIVVIKEEEVFLNEMHVQCVYDYLHSRDDLIVDQSVRLLVMKISIALNENNSSLLDLGDLVEVSKNTALKYINQIKQELKDFNIKLSYSRKQGYQLYGSEAEIRQYLIKCIYELLAIPVGRQIMTDKKLIDMTECAFIYKRLEKVEKRLNITFTDEMLEAIPYTSFLVIKRIKNGAEAYTFSSEIKELIKSKEYGTISSVFWNFDFLKEGDLVYLALLVLSSNLIDSNSELYNLENFRETLHQFIKNLENKLAISFCNREKLMDSLSRHLRGTLFRLELGVDVFNPLTDDFVSHYTSIYQLVKHELKIFQSITSKSFPDKEITFISMIILGNLIENSKKMKDKSFKAVVVCKSGTSISKLLKTVLQDMFDYIDFERVYSFRQFNNADHKTIDFVFSTIPLQTDRPVVLVSSVLNNQEKQKIRKEVKQIIDSDSVKKAKYIISYLSDYLQQEKHNEALEEIQHALTFDTSLESRSDDIEELLKTPEQVSLVRSELKWQTLIDTAFEPLIERNSIVEQYTERTKTVFYDNYETMLIGPNVLLPHVTPENDVKHCDVQILILKEPIEAPNGQTYDIVVALAPGANNEHVKWLIRLNERLVDPSFKEKLSSAKSREDVVTIIREEGVLV